MSHTFFIAYDLGGVAANLSSTSSEDRPAALQKLASVALGIRSTTKHIQLSVSCAQATEFPSYFRPLPVFWFSMDLHI